MATTNQQQTDEFPLKDQWADRPVPEDERLPWFKPALVWLGFSTQFISFYVGGQVERVVGMPGAVYGIMLGCVFLCILSGLIAWASAKWGFSFPMQCRATFGSRGFLVPSLFLAFLVNGWFAYQALATGDVWHKVWGVHPGWASFVFALLFAATALKFRFMVWARYLAVPALFIFIGYLFVYTIIPNWELAWTHKVENPDFSFAVATGISFFIISSIMTGDMVRFCKKPLDSVWVTIVAFMVGNGIALSMGAIATAASPELSQWFGMVALQLGIPLVLTTTWINWASGDACLYNAVMGYSNAHPKIQWKQAIIFGGIIGAIAAGTGALKTVVPWMLMIGTLVPPIGGVLVADYYWVRGGNYDFGRDASWNWLALFSIVIGILFAWVSLKAIPWLPNQITGVVVAGLAYGLLAKAFGRQKGLYPSRDEMTSAETPLRVERTSESE